MAHKYAVETELLRGPLRIPETVPEVGVRKSILEDLALKTLYVTGPLSIMELAAMMRLTFRVVDELVHRLRAEQLCEVTGMSGNVAHIAISARGRSRAMECLSMNQYVGSAPVSLDSYKRQVEEQSVRNLQVHLPEIQRAFSHLVLDSATLKKLGTALNSGSSIFLYGPAGTGKTSIAMALSRAVATDPVWIPYAVEVEGQIISVYDPQVHTKVADPVTDDSDTRWVLCRRPMMIVGGELTIEMLELQLNQVTKFYSAPVQMKANNGVLVIDDFGRQRVRPEELLNRWIVPLDRRIDFLTLAGGQTVEIPFEMFVVFATNLDPSTLADAAFLRRIQTKVRVGAVSPEHFHEISRRICDDFELQYDAPVIDELIDIIRNKLKELLRACHPRDLLNQIRWAASFEGSVATLDRDALAAAVDAYFVPEGQDPDN
jgi:predicted ATPase with chaperone activity